MLYHSLEEIRARANPLGRELNAATNYGRQPLPKQFADKQREWCELAEIYTHPSLWFKNPERLIKGAIEVVEAS